MAKKLDPDNTMTETDLGMYARKGTLQEVHLVETRDGFMVVAHITWRPEEDLYWATRRDRTQPRFFKDVGRLLDQLRTVAPQITSVTVDLLPVDTAPRPKRRQAGRGRPRRKPDDNATPSPDAPSPAVGEDARKRPRRPG